MNKIKIDTFQYNLVTQNKLLVKSKIFHVENFRLLTIENMRLLCDVNPDEYSIVSYVTDERPYFSTIYPKNINASIVPCYEITGIENNLAITVSEKIANIFEFLTPENLISSGYTRVNGPDIDLNIKSKTVFLTPNLDGILVIGNPFQFLAGLSEKQRKAFEPDETMSAQMGNLRVSIYFAKAACINRCIEYYKDVTLKEISRQEEESLKLY